MPIPIPDTEDDKALWVRAEQLAEELLDFHDRAPVMAQDDVRTHQGYLEKGESAEHEFFERLFLEAATEPDRVKLLLERIWIVYQHSLWG